MTQRRLLVRILLGAGVLGVAIAPAVGANWSRFRGPNGTGIAPDTGVPVHWNEQSIRWKALIPGVGNSSPIVWEDRVFLQSAAQDGSERWLLCLGARDGKMLWTRSVPGAHARMHPKNTLASSTPATDGQRVYALFWDGQDVSMQAFDLDGRPVWKRGLGPFKSQHGPGTSPVVYKDRVFVANDQDGVSMLVALDARTGEPMWQAPRRPFRACYSTPMVLDGPDGPELIVVSTAGVTNYEPEAGTENWSWTWTFDGAPLRTIGSPVVGDGLIFVNSGDGGGARHTIALRPGGKHNQPPAHIAWEQKRTWPYVPSLLFWQDRVYSVNDQGFAGCGDAKTGATVWSERLGGGMSASPVLINGNIYAASEDGNVYVFPAAPRFQLLAKNAIGEPVLATPAVADNHLFIRGRQHLFCIGPPAPK